MTKATDSPAKTRKTWKQAVREAIRRLGYDVSRYSPNDLSSLVDMTEKQKQIILQARPNSMASLERMASLIHCVEYLVANNISGDIAECGVWRGGSMVLTALTLLEHGDTTRELFLYDTFEGMSAPSANDKDFQGKPAILQLLQEPEGTGIWCFASIEEVRANLLATGYPQDKIHLIKGKVEDTIPGQLPSGLALLRLDTDWYESTRHELVHLYPLLRKKGVLILDDYGHWQGAKMAADEYFQQNKITAFLHRIDYTGRLLIKETNG